MAWWNGYDRNYRGYGGGGYGGYYGRGYFGYGYERDFRVAPERSPTYGWSGDRAARRYARSHGHDAGYPIQPHRQASWQGGWGGEMSRSQSARGEYGNYGSYGRAGGGYRGYGDASYDWNYRW